MGEEKIQHKNPPKHGAANTAFSIPDAKRALVDKGNDGRYPNQVFLLKSPLRRPLVHWSSGI